MTYVWRWARTAAVALGVVVGLMAPAGATSEDIGAAFYTKTCITPHLQSTCAARMANAARKKAYEILRCYERALEEGREVSQQCLDQAERHFSDRFDDGLDEGDCLSSVSEGQLEDTVLCFVRQVLCEITAGGLCPNICQD